MTIFLEQPDTEFRPHVMRAAIEKARAMSAPKTQER
ncbi:hypothetical protein SAMN05216376_103219 [Mameliella alba]|uniref:Uncharacterized protein n=1 Tax=Mameliella alba TaxID=561184 RepID=A0A0B3SXN5_9RHOB|nr:hypothetical protein OA50_00215 [Mameliella alba]SDC60575.1 hypothetical protein SAMN05216376_103219 [Mameliella alba]